MEKETLKIALNEMYVLKNVHDLSASLKIWMWMNFI